VRRGFTGAPHEEVGDEHPAAAGCNGVAFPAVGLLADAQCLQLHLEGLPVDNFRRSGVMFLLFHVVAGYKDLAGRRTLAGMVF
jgi:hypothetical protein